MAGSVLSGFLGRRLKMKTVLTGIYGMRVFIAAGFLILPKTVPFAFAATALLGLNGDATVAPTTGLISRRVGVARMAVVYGAIFIGHQLGAFCSALLGGAAAGGPWGYSALWLADLVLSAAAAAASFLIREQ